MFEGGDHDDDDDDLLGDHVLIDFKWGSLAIYGRLPTLRLFERVRLALAYSPLTLSRAEARGATEVHSLFRDTKVSSLWLVIFQ